MWRVWESCSGKYLVGSRERRWIEGFVNGEIRVDGEIRVGVKGDLKTVKMRALMCDILRKFSLI